ncbi:MAG TPA: Hsp20/alpha crystallin family protein [Thermodesulfobacteriaceae bacterium]|nr:Hsp20/alpha crystallin family protein [Thermodesulfobacteriaceae bacterium]
MFPDNQKTGRIKFILITFCANISVDEFRGTSTRRKHSISTGRRLPDMPDLMLWKDEQLRQIRNEMDLLFDMLWEDFKNPVLMRHLRKPSINIIETDDNIVVTADIQAQPGKLECTVAGDRLTINRRRSREFCWRGGRLRKSGWFSSTIKLPAKVEAESAKATFRDGLLKITLCKKKENQVTQIKIDIAE